MRFGGGSGVFAGGVLVNVFHNFLFISLVVMRGPCELDPPAAPGALMYGKRRGFI
jgi:hypothetical protein